LRNRRLFSLSEINAAIAELVGQINGRVTRHLRTSRRALFDEIERGALKPLPIEPYRYAEWKQCKVAFDYHVVIAIHPFRSIATGHSGRSRPPVPIDSDRGRSACG
jgi:hypothetical protein